MKQLMRAIRGAALLLAFCHSPWIPALSAGDDWMPIDPGDLTLRDNPKSPGADAMILYRNSMVDAIESSDSEYIRIKVFTQAGTKYADVEISFIKGFDEIRDIRARTIRPDGTIVNFQGKPFDKTVLKVSGAKYLAKAFTLPDVRPGSIIEYKYRDQYDPNLYINQEWTLQRGLFTRLGRFAVKPDTRPGAAQLYFRSYRLPNTVVPQKQSNGWYALEVRDLPGIDEEEYMPPERSLQARIEFYYRGAAEPQKETTDEFWKRIGKNWNEGMDRFVDKKGALSAEVSRTISPDDPPETKIRKLYARVQQIRNLSMEESKSEKEEKAENLKLNMNVRDVLKHGYGSSRQINYTFIGLLRAAGFDATALFVAPRTGDVFRPETRDTTQLNADLVWVHTAAQDYFLDPGARYYSFGSIPWIESSARGIRVTKEGGIMAQTPDLPSTQCIIIRNASLTLDDAGAASGTLEVEYTNETGAMHRHDDRDEDQAGRKKALQDEIKGWLSAGSTFEITNVANWENIDLPLHVEGTVKVPGLASSVGRRLLFPAEIFQAGEARSFQSEKRVNPIWFNYPFEVSDDLKIRVPPGYKPETALPAASVKPARIVSYDLTVQAVDDQIEVKRHLVINGTAFATSAYPAFRAFFGAVKTNDEAQIILQANAPAKSK